MRIHENAVLDNMLTTRFRSFRPVLLVTLYNLLLLGTIVIIKGVGSLLYGLDANSTGIALFSTIVIFQFSLIVFIMPALTAGLISGERERKTMDLLLCTQLSPFGIIIGKLLSGCMYMGLCVVSSIPMITMAYLYGGVSALSILSIVACYLVTIIAIGSLGIFCSVIFKRTTTAVLVAYLSVFILGVISTIGGYIDLAYQANVFGGVANYAFHYPMLWIYNPFMALIEIIGSSSGLLGSLMSMAGQNQWPAMWGWVLLTLTVISVGLILLSTRILAPKKGWRLWKNGGNAGKPVK
jgi:ABC-2 type transport system permease protein